MYVVGDAWHAEIGIPTRELSDGLAFYRKIFPAARVIMFSYGKQTFFTAPPHTLSEYLLGPIPGPAVIQVVALNVMPPEAYPPEDTITLVLPAGGGHALSTYIGNDLATDASGRPQVVAPSTNPDGLFYAARSEYNLFHTCNTWAADALHEAGLPVSGSGVVFSGQVMSRAADAAESQCRFAYGE
ncbi:MAG: DUF2459 domain-containing protein [Alphaproteobacteria bacterium]|nr:DUF2459 domain-containing protein [Alphaproteobacteria bacterium]